MKTYRYERKQNRILFPKEAMPEDGNYIAMRVKDGVVELWTEREYAEKMEKWKQISNGVETGKLCRYIFSQMIEVEVRRGEVALPERFLLQETETEIRCGGITYCGKEK